MTLNSRGTRALLSLAAVAAVTFVAHPVGGLASADVSGLTDRASAAGLYPTFNNTWAATVVDYDNDGDEDIWIGYHQSGVLKDPRGGGRLWQNQGDGTYVWVAQDAWPRIKPNGYQPDRHDCAFADFDQNGLPDAYCSAGRNESNRVKTGMENELWLQVAPGEFTDVGAEWGVGDECGRGRFVAILDANGDGWDDIFLGNETPRVTSTDPCDNPANGLPNEESKIYLNVDGAGFRYAPELIRFGAGPGQRCALSVDANNDGWEDLIACRLKGQLPLFYRNNGGTGFTLLSGTSSGLSTSTADVTTADLNGDGLMDIVSAHRTYFSYQLNTGGTPTFGPRVRIWTVTQGEGRSVAVADADADGDLDVYGMMGNGNSSGNPPDVLLVNNGSLGFSSVAPPAATGQADEVVAVMPIEDGGAEFLSLNGGNKTGGPIQLVTAGQ